MNKNSLWLIFVLLIVYLALVFCNETESASQIVDENNAVQSELRTDLVDEARTRRRHHKLWHLWGWHALAIAYWIKVKLVIVAFFVGSAVFVALRYVWPHKCSHEVEGPIVYDNPHSFSPHDHHDHIPYSFDHSSHFDHSFDASSSGFEPYSAYSGVYGDDAVTADAVDVIPSTAPATHRIGRRSAKKRQQKPPMKTEEQIAEFMFSFLGLDSIACRRRFICEMEFRSHENPLTSMAFRIVGRGFFGKYTNARNTQGQAKSFAECAVVNPECVFIEQNVDDNDDMEESAAAAMVEGEVEEEGANNTETNEVKTKNDKSSAENNVDTDLEEENVKNLKAERRVANLRQRGDRKMNNLAAHILAQTRQN